MLTTTQIEHIGDALGFQGPAIRGLSQQLIDHIYELEDRIELLEQEKCEDDGQPSEYDEWQDFYGGDDWDHGQYDEVW